MMKRRTNNMKKMISMLLVLVMALSLAACGKTADEVASIAVDETTKPTDADLLTSVTIKIGEFQNLIAKACG